MTLRPLLNLSLEGRLRWSAERSLLCCSLPVYTVMCLDATYEKLQASQLAVYPVYERALPVYENMGAQFDRRH